jgi:glutamyl-tRNA synthetase
LKEEVRVRFAPSPTGFLHVGGARTALFNYLFARKHKGSFILRIEDTDPSRSQEKYISKIIEDLSWLGLCWDEGPDKEGEFAPYRQSERLSIYQKFFEVLKEKGLVYPCFCQPEELRRRREEALKKGLAPKYDRRCRYLSEKERKEKIKREKASWRFKLDEKGALTFKDLIKGEIKFDLGSFSDFVLIRSDGNPSFHFAMVVDDALMEITHVIRGEDHLTNTLYHLLLFKALGFSPPYYAHLPMVLSSEKEKLSKREDALSVFHLREEGYLPEAVVNFLALLGYTPPKEIISLKELVETFSFDKVGKSPSVVSLEKLKSLNSHYLRKKKGEEIYKIAEKALLKEVGEEKVLKEKEFLIKVLEVTRENVFTVKDFIPYVKIFLQEDLDYGEEVKGEIRKELARKSIEVFYRKVVDSECTGKEEIKKILFSSLKNLGEVVKKKDFYRWLRISLTSLSSGPPLVEVILILGKERVVKRLKKALEVSQFG